MDQLLSPPEKWQDFEKLLSAVFKGYSIYGRPGQKQDGIDLYNVHATRKSERCVIQAKHKDFDKVLTIKMVEDYVSKAETYNEQLSFSKLIIATTMKKDAKLQLEVSRLSERTYEKNKYTVEIIFWQDIQDRLNQMPEVRSIFYSNDVDKGADCVLYNYLASTLYFSVERYFNVSKLSLEDIKLIEEQIVYLCDNCNPELGVKTNGNAQEILTNFLIVFKDLFFARSERIDWPNEEIKDCWFAGREVSLGNRKRLFQRLSASDTTKIQNADDMFRMLINILIKIVNCIRDCTVEDTPGVLSFAKRKNLTELDKQLREMKEYYLYFNDDVESCKDSLVLFNFMLKSS
ncbi:hypothetical protein C9J19_20540 [Photobacterium phosphoreum]|uniref:restriction endonuclease n=1 Tax=Photobacterium phosphoreum TaxID=659 RepID=UPI000D173CCA|nr:restriction endonuclease [Photobacterium phosphoreum]PSW23939.1 hypothetical protein C9J19_20540 [Photobacterium phosphoreum]